MYDRKRFFELCKEDGVPLMPSSGKLKIILDGTLCDITEDNVRKLLLNGGKQTNNHHLRAALNESGSLAK